MLTRRPRFPFFPWLWCLSLGMALMLAPLSADDASAHGLRIKEGAFWLKGRPCRAVGVNYFDCFTQMLVEDAAASETARQRCETGFRELKKLGIPFVRFNAGGFYPKDWRLYEEAPAVYFSRFETLVNLAEQEGLGLVPSLFWTFFTQAGRAGEPLAALGEAQSRTHELMRRYVHEVVEKFRHSPAIWAWEFGNEYNLESDIPNQLDHRKRWFHPHLGMPAAPGPRDVIHSRDLRVAWQTFAEAVRARDPDRPLFTGSACPRRAAWHLEHEGSWERDSPEQWTLALEAQNPPAYGGLSLHFYPFHGDDTGLAGQPPEATLAAAAGVARRTGQPLWVGEFGFAPHADAETRETQWTTILRWLEEHGVTLAAAWVYDFAKQPEYSLSLTGPHRRLLEMLGEVNARWQIAPP